jgi:hypothetical protein
VKGARNLHLRRLQPSESRELHAWISERHYLESCPPGHRYALEITLGGERIGGMLLGRPDARSIDERLWLQLTRMVFIDATPANVESQSLAMMRRFVRVWVPEVRCLLSYSDPEVGHAGIVYLADGWAPFGETRNSTKGWRSRPGRKGGEGAPSRKTRWVRTP